MFLFKYIFVLKVVCSDACQFSCSKQENVNISPMTSKENSVSEYKFIIPNEATKSAVKAESFQPLLTFDPILSSIPTSTSATNVEHKICEVECMPECTFACTTLKPALKLISQIVDSHSTTMIECQKTCGDSCLRVCRSSGITMNECSANCAPACGQSCGFIKNTMCVPSCLPSCSTQCVEVTYITYTNFYVLKILITY
uniref:TIL domain-containing protein n=1 Tax=Heterorhabditis bacteriophora TaxID=37862 RepID=A0A1I7XEI4_HETBA